MKPLLTLILDADSLDALEHNEDAITTYETVGEREALDRGFRWGGVERVSNLGGMRSYKVDESETSWDECLDDNQRVIRWQDEAHDVARLAWDAACDV